MPGSPGPFAFADPGRVRRILECAGFAEVELAGFDTRIGGNSLDDTLKLVLRVGPLGALLRENPELAPKVAGPVREALSAHVQEGAVWSDAAVWIVTGRRP